MIVENIIILAGLMLRVVLFNRFPLMARDHHEQSLLKISVIIPARNEEKNLPLLLDDLQKQSEWVNEIICVDDESMDKTGKIARLYSTRVITLNEKPEGWMGKSWACQNGADAASGDVLLFLDADVRLGPNAIRRLVQAYEHNGCVISVQPYHQIIYKYEELSLFFNFIQFAANGLGLPYENKNIGLYGPVILISRSDYNEIGGHDSIKASIIDDVALGEKLKLKGIPFKLYLGDQELSFRMYGGGLKDLVQGWTKNQATGAMKTPFTIFLMVFLWITSCTSVAIQLIIAIMNLNLFGIAFYSILYFIWVLELRRIARHLGSFSLGGIIIYPVLLGFYLAIFFRSVMKKIFHIKVTWKERKI